MDRLEPPAEGALIETLRKQITPRLTVKAAAEKIGISDRRWRQIETGSKSEGGAVVPVHATSDRLACMAQVVGATPDQLRAAGRDDAADLLENGVESAPNVRGSVRAPVPAAAAGTAFTAEERDMVADVAVRTQRVAMRAATLAGTESDPGRSRELIILTDDLIEVSAAMSHLVARTATVADSIRFQSAAAEVISRRNRAFRRIEGGDDTSVADIASQESRAHEFLLDGLRLEQERIGDRTAGNT